MRLRLGVLGGLVIPLVWACGSGTSRAVGGSVDALGADAGADADASADASPDVPSGADAGADASDAPEDVAADVTCADGFKACAGQCVSTGNPAHGCAGARCAPCIDTGAIVACVAGACAIDHCTGGHVDCNQDPLDGCESDSQTDERHCGSCSLACAPGHACQGGACVCPAGQSACGGDCFDLKTTLAHCGDCAKDCGALHLAACANGACGGGCAAGFDDCDGDATNGCETDLASHDHCGSCGHACAAKGTCASGTCAEPRCAGGGDGLSNCGPAGASDCCASHAVPGGTFARSYDGAVYTDPTYAATVSGFVLDDYEVTVGRFRVFVAAWLAGFRPAVGAGKHAHLPLGGLDDGTEPGWTKGMLAQVSGTAADFATNLSCNNSLSTWTTSPTTNERRPVDCVSWAEAYAFCIWDGGFLPSEAEWNFAASGGADQRVFPWTAPGTQPSIDPSDASFFDGTDCLGDGQPGCAATDIVPVGSLPNGNGRWGHADLAGNVSEWTLDVFLSPYDTPCVDCAYLGGGVGRAFRGGSFHASPPSLVVGHRDYSLQLSRASIVGFRCARSP